MDKDFDLLEAARRGNLNSVRNLHAQGGRLDYREHSGQTAIWHAVNQGHGEVIRFLVENRADVNTIVNGETLLHLSSRNHDPETTALLVELNADLNAKDKDGRTPIFKSVEGLAKNYVTMKRIKRGIKTIRVLLANGADPRKADRDGMTPMHYAAEKGSTHALGALLEKNPGLIDLRTRSKSTPLHHAVYYVAETKDDRPLKTLLEKGANPNARDSLRETPLVKAAKLGCAQAVEELVKHGANPSAKSSEGFPAVFEAAYEGHPEVIRTLARIAPKSLRAKFGRNTVLHAAIGAENVEAARELLEAGLNVNAKGEDGYTPLQTALEIQNREAAELLLRHGADPEIKNDKGRPANYFTKGYTEGRELLETFARKARRQARKQLPRLKAFSPRR